MQRRGVVVKRGGTECRDSVRDRVFLKGRGVKAVCSGENRDDVPFILIKLVITNLTTFEASEYHGVSAPCVTRHDCRPQPRGKSFFEFQIHFEFLGEAGQSF